MFRFNSFFPYVLAFVCGSIAAETRFQGFGASTQAGTRMPVVTVASLADSGPGSLRKALSAGNRRIVFQISGKIYLKSPLFVGGSRVTVDGSSAPGPGITILGKPVILDGVQDIIFSNVRIRDSNDDNLRLLGDCRRIVIDHCSLTSAGDGALDITQNYKTQKAPQDVTIAWCLIALTEKASLISQASRLSIHHCLFSNNSQRNPQLHSVKIFDFRNNVLRRWLVYGMRLRYGSSGNLVNNLFMAGTNRHKKADRVLVILRNAKNKKASAGPVFLSGNQWPPGVAPEAFRCSSEIPAPVIKTAHTGNLLKIIEANVGALPHDALDRRIIMNSSELEFRPSVTKDAQ